MIDSDGSRVPVELSSATFTDSETANSEPACRFATCGTEKRTERDLRLLAELGAVLGLVHHESSLNDVAPLLVRNLADLGIFYLADADGELRRAAVATRHLPKAPGLLTSSCSHRTTAVRRPCLHGRFFATDSR